MRHSAAVGDYLKAIYKLQAGEEPVTTLALAARLGVSAASATGMVKKLASQELVEHTPYHGVRLTARGAGDALELIRHHRLLELFLTREVGMPWEKVDAEAERLEHVLSEDLEDRLDAILGHPTSDPHGDPIPSRAGAVAAQSLERLSELDGGTRAIVRRVSDSDPEALCRLAAARLFPGAHVQVVERTGEAPRRLRVDAEECSLRASDAARVFVERADDVGWDRGAAGDMHVDDSGPESPVAPLDVDKAGAAGDMPMDDMGLGAGPAGAAHVGDVGRQ